MLQKLVFILGGRCGSSTLAKLLYELGYPLPGPLDVVSRKPNLQGHYENIDVRSINCRLLAAYKLSPFNPGVLPFSKDQDIQKWSKAHSKLAFVKDPALALTWPVWKASLTREILWIICCRNPVEVTNSWAKWYELSLKKAANIVKMYNLGTNAGRQEFEYFNAHLSDPDRISRCCDWLKAHDIHPEEMKK